MKKFLVLAAFLSLGAMAFAGGQKNATTAAPAAAPVAAAPTTQVIRWSFWGGESRIKNTQLVIDKFTETTSIIVAAEPAPGTGEHFTKFKTQFAGGNAADIIQLGGDFSNLQVGDDVGTVLLPLTEYVNSRVIDLSKVDASAIAKGTVNGTLYALPVAGNMPALVYNKSLLERVGAPLPKVSMDWAEFRAWLEEVQAKLPPDTYALTDNSANADQSSFFGYWGRQNGTKIWDGTKSYITAPDVQKYFDLWADYRAAGLIPPAATAADYAETNESSASIIAGKTVVTILWSNMLLNYQNATTDTLDLIELPNAAANNSLWGNMSQMMAVNKNSKNPAAAAQFINYRVNNPDVWKVMGADPGTPVNSEARAALPSSPSSDKVNAYLDIAGQHAGAQDPNVPGDTEWGNSFYLIAQNVAYGQISTAQAGQQVIDLIARLTR
jgi:multiple sugar transport system substrate-binding protein